MALENDEESILLILSSDHEIKDINNYLNVKYDVIENKLYFNILDLSMFN